MRFFKSGLWIYLILFTINGLPCFLAIKNQWDYGAANFLCVLLSILYLSFLERLKPFRKDWHPTAGEWKRDVCYFFLVVLVGAAGQSLINALAIHLARATLSFPQPFEAMLALAVVSFLGYGYHRFSHGHVWLWKVHGIHHLPSKVNLANNQVVHFIDVISGAFLAQVPLYLIGVSAESAFIAAIFTSMQGYFIHSNIDIDLGPLSYLIASPQGHRLHHSRKLDEAGNFGSDLAIWDLMFGSFTWESQKSPVSVGTEDEAHFPSPFRIFACALFPLRWK